MWFCRHSILQRAPRQERQDGLDDVILPQAQQLFIVEWPIDAVSIPSCSPSLSVVGLTYGLVPPVQSEGCDSPMVLESESVTLELPLTPCFATLSSEVAAVFADGGGLGGGLFGRLS